MSEDQKDIIAISFQLKKGPILFFILVDAKAYDNQVIMKIKKYHKKF